MAWVWEKGEIAVSSATKTAFNSQHHILLTDKTVRLTELSLFLTAVIWALNFSIIKVSLQEIDPLSFNGIRFLFAAAIIWLFLLRRGESLTVHKGDWPKLIGMGLMGNLVYQGLFIIGIDLTLSANAAVMLGTIPVWVALFSHFFTEERLNLIKGAGVLSAFLGIIGIMAGGEHEISFGSSTFLGDLIILAAAMVWGGYTLISRSFLKRYSPIQFSTLMVSIGAVVLFLVGLPSMLRQNWAEVSIPAYGGIVYSGSLAIGLAYIIWNFGIRNVGPVRSATFQNLVPVLGLLFGVVLLDEQMTLIQLGGAGFVIIGIFLARVKK